MRNYNHKLLFILFLLVQFWKIDTGWTQSGNQSAKCGFHSRVELTQTARDIVERFSKLDYQDLHLHALANESLTSKQPSSAVSAAVTSALNHILSDPALVVPKSTGMATVVFGDGNGACHGLPCAWPGTFSVFLPPDWLNQFAAKAKQDFESSMLIVLGHEMGHHVYDAIFKADAGYPRVSVSGPITPLRYHLTIDAIGSLLAGKNLDDVISVLKLTLLNSTFEGDGSDRIQCLAGLPE